MTLGQRTVLVAAEETGLSIGGASVSDRLDVQAGSLTIHLVDALVRVPTVREAVETESLEALRSLAARSGSQGLSVFGSRGGITLFAPTNRALGSVDTSTLSEGARLQILQRHLVAGAFTLEVAEQQNLMSRTDELLNVLPGAAGGYTLQGQNRARVPVVGGDMLLRDGMVHVIEGVVERSTE